MKKLHYITFLIFALGCFMYFLVQPGVFHQPTPAVAPPPRDTPSTSNAVYKAPFPPDYNPVHDYFKTVIQALLKREEATITIEEVVKQFTNSLKKPTRRKLILAYTPYFEDYPWKMFNNSTFNSLLGQKGCPLYNCDFTCDRKYLNDSDAVLFHGRDMTPLLEMRRMMKLKLPHQRWVFFIRENPIHTYLNLQQYNGLFNWTMTYKRDSDIEIPGGAYYHAQTNVTGNENYAEGKDKLVYWPVSNCGNFRDEIAKKLNEFVPLDVYGGCRIRVFPKSGRGPPCPRFSKECESLLRRYKFRLSFENKNCVDYITEKYWKPLETGNIPIVLGGANYSEMVVPGSYINALDFPSVKALAEYIKYLDKNDTAYNEYFQWRKYYIAKKDALTFPCQLCTALNLNLKPKVYNNFEKYWGVQENCGVNDAKMKNML